MERSGHVGGMAVGETASSQAAGQIGAVSSGRVILGCHGVLLGVRRRPNRARVDRCNPLALVIRMT